MSPRDGYRHPTTPRRLSWAHVRPDETYTVADLVTLTGITERAIRTNRVLRQSARWIRKPTPRVKGYGLHWLGADVRGWWQARERGTSGRTRKETT